jgi:hypothetical protein
LPHLGVLRQALAQQFEVAQYDREQVVEVVSDASGQSPNGLYLLRLEKRSAGLLKC